MQFYVYITNFISQKKGELAGDVSTLSIIWTIHNTPKSDVKEVDIRKILKTLGLPEHHVVTIKRIGYTYYELEPSETKRKELLKQAETAENERKLTFKLRKIVRKIQPNATVYVRLTNEEKLVNLSIYCELTKDEKTNRLHIKEWEKRGFKTTKFTMRTIASKSFELSGKETLSEIEKLLINAV